MLFKVFFIAILLFSVVSCTFNEINDMQIGNDKAFIQKLQDSIDSKKDMCEIDKAVGIQSLMNSCRDRDRSIIKHTDFGPDSDDEVSFKYLHQASDIVYWTIEHPTIAKIIGIYWDSDGKARIFRAIIYPP